MLQDVKSYLGRCFAMKDLGEAAYILGIKIYRDRSRWLIGLCQSAYIEKILKRFHMENSKRGSIPMQDKLRLSKSQGASTPAKLKCMQNVPYASVVGSIMYVVRCTRPDVAFAQNITSRFQQNPSDLHWTTVKNILKYLRNTKDMFLVYGGDLKRELRISCYTDAGYLTDADDLKSQTGHVFVLNGGVVDWKSVKQSIFASSSAEAEYIAAFDASKEANRPIDMKSGITKELLGILDCFPVVVSRKSVSLDFSHLENWDSTILQSSLAIHHISNLDNMYINSSSFSLFSSLPGVLTPVRAINGFDMPLPVAVCSGLVNPLAPRKAPSPSVILLNFYPMLSTLHISLLSKACLFFHHVQQSIAIFSETAAFLVASVRDVEETTIRSAASSV
ncbi:retrotransposon protein, putative, ty1-copia subclass, partial [Tanacetum coccineum]